jgi:hypothetical protein
MMDQLASIGCEFDLHSVRYTFKLTREFYEAQKEKDKGIPWAIPSIYQSYRPIRPWGLAAISRVTGILNFFTGLTIRTPGMYKKTDPDTGITKDEFLEDTNERIHSSVRVRLALKGLDTDDRYEWKCPALMNWQLRRAQRDLNMGPGFQWVWEFNGLEKNAPPVRIMPEEPLGSFEQLHLQYSGGSPNVFVMAEQAFSQTSNQQPPAEPHRKWFGLC